MKRTYLVLGHLFFWSLFLISDTLRQQASGSWGRHQNQLWLISAAYLLVTLTAFYGGYGLIYRFIIRRWPWPGWLGLVNVLTTLLLIVATRYIVEFGFLKPLIQYDNYEVNTHFTWSWFAQNAALYYWNWVVYGVLYGFAQHYVRQQQRAREQMKAEVSLLRAQVNPHFLFNVLNDFYALSLTRPTTLPDSLLKLADLLRYMLYSSQSSAVPLTEEIAYLRSYIDLEQLGQSGQARVQTAFSGPFESWQIAPMLLIPFVENAFKHGGQAPQAILMGLTAGQTRLRFTCRNAKQGGTKDKTGGLGLANLRRRLELEYPGRHHLRIADTETEFTVQLTLTR
ncbi:MAG: hypothetical protein EOO39_10375 [Cytophagaceae bacterium]|nr:MAG: hypothetical protein EOO39_10375 [Cytophagaceae bacterium]